MVRKESLIQGAYYRGTTRFGHTFIFQFRSIGVQGELYYYRFVCDYNHEIVTENTRNMYVGYYQSYITLDRIPDEEGIRYFNKEGEKPANHKLTIHKNLKIRFKL